jgi:uncharacterized MAPEG superfamily protein
MVMLCCLIFAASPLFQLCIARKPRTSRNSNATRAARDGRCKRRDFIASAAISEIHSPFAPDGERQQVLRRRTHL